MLSKVISVFDEDVRFADGYLHLAETPGLGPVMNEKRIEKVFKM